MLSTDMLRAWCIAPLMQAFNEHKVSADSASKPVAFTAWGYGNSEHCRGRY